MMIQLAAACRNTSVRRTTGTAPDDVGQHLPGSDGRQLVDVADDEQRRVVRRRLRQPLHQYDVDHRGLVDNEQIAVEGIVAVAFEPAALGIDLQEPLDCLRRDACRFGHALGCATQAAAARPWRQGRCRRCRRLCPRSRPSSDRSSSRAARINSFGASSSFSASGISWQPAMSLVHRICERIRYSGAQSNYGGLFDAELHRDRVGGLQADALDITGKPIGILGHDLHGVGAVSFEDAVPTPLL